MSSHKSPSGAGARPIKTIPTASSLPNTANKSKTTAGTNTSSSSSSLKDTSAGLSEADAAASNRNRTLTAEATAIAYPLLNSPYNADEDVEEDVDEESIRAQMADLLKEENEPTVPLSLELIRQRALPPELLNSGNQELITRKLFSLDRIYLDGLHLSSLDDCFDLFTRSLTHLYLQRNALTETRGLECLKNLQFLMLAHNRITVLEGLGELEHLMFLDVSHNCIELVDTGSADDDDDAESTCQLPESLVVFNCAGNPFVEESDDYIEHIVTVSPYLKQLNGTRITNKMRRDFGLEASDDDDDGDNGDSQLLSASAPKPAATGDIDKDVEDDESAAATRLRQQTEEMTRRSQHRTMMYDTEHGVSPLTTNQDRDDALAKLKQEEIDTNQK